MSKVYRVLGVLVGAFVFGFLLAPTPTTAETAACECCEDHCPSQWSFYEYVEDAG